ncbi:hypothetical protein [Acinetobacter defluvii]|uniref:hypothetical protein n=1 Tax=Acinetobacter defluvii TaxID=1871111 RepID=UPI00148F24C7|nr:hypothetical protein [Acinetobacter defluvii]
MSVKVDVKDNNLDLALEQLSNKQYIFLKPSNLWLKIDLTPPYQATSNVFAVSR